MGTPYETFEKEPREDNEYTYDFAPKLKPGATIVQFAPGFPKATRVSDSTDTTSTVLSGITVSGTIVTFHAKAGADGERHRIEFVVIDSFGETSEGGLFMEVVEE
jgi:hypothetical protein